VRTTLDIDDDIVQATKELARDESVFDGGHILGPNQITDVYLLALAVRNGGRLVTFNRGLPLKAVRGAGPDTSSRFDEHSARARDCGQEANPLGR
jgi:predicted nucleic acid-binding protein